MPARWSIFLIILGTVLVIVSVFRHVARRRQFGSGYDEYINKVRLPKIQERNEFGEKVKWAIDLDERDEDGSS